LIAATDWKTSSGCGQSGVTDRVYQSCINNEARCQRVSFSASIDSLLANSVV